MSAINYRLNNGPVNKVEFTKELRIGSDNNLNHLVLPANAGVASQHAVVIRAVVGKLPVLVSLAGSGLRVNRQTVVSLRVLHHGDRIEVGNAELELREIQIKRLLEMAHRMVCPICDGTLKVDDEVVSCPSCERTHHRGCWFDGEHCSTFACQYPIHQTVIQALSPPVSFITKLEKSHKLVTNQKVCLSSAQSDLGVPFQQNDDVAFCPKCEAALHLRCWLASAKCPGCLYDIKPLIDAVFEAPSVASA